MTEFDIIKRYFAEQHMLDGNEVRIGIGDDAAIVNAPLQSELAITTDTLVEGVHFLTTALAFDIGHKALAVNLSDLAAMGAEPLWVTLALTLPQVDHHWLSAFCEGFFSLAHRYQVKLIGGDLTRGPLSITIQAIGKIPLRQALLRSTAEPHDLIYVTGTLGDAGLALKHLQSQAYIDPYYQSAILERLHRPEPRVVIGQSLRKLASAAIDISDGLMADLGHILTASQVGAIVYVDRLPFSPGLAQSTPLETAITLGLTSGDDYELCFTVPTKKREELEKNLSALACRYSCIGQITQRPDLILCYENGTPYYGSINGYQHF
jgi:thiamine-monophosphate kinase